VDVSCPSCGRMVYGRSPAETVNREGWVCWWCEQKRKKGRKPDLHYQDKLKDLAKLRELLR
jgi:hypothetical protein